MGEPATSMPAKAMRSLKKWNVKSLAQSIFIKNEGLHWGHSWKNLEARIAMLRSQARNSEEDVENLAGTEHSHDPPEH